MSKIEEPRGRKSARAKQVAAAVSVLGVSLGMPAQGAGADPIKVAESGPSLQQKGTQLKGPAANQQKFQAPGSQQLKLQGPGSQQQKFQGPGSLQQK